jgi:hypothetical protein
MGVTVEKISAGDGKTYPKAGESTSALISTLDLDLDLEQTLMFRRHR